MLLRWYIVVWSGFNAVNTYQQHCYTPLYSGLQITNFYIIERADSLLFFGLSIRMMAESTLYKIRYYKAG
ncbi:hypothetical protein AAY24_17635 [Sedimenticola thiotaurini]|uniref:Uncharacterized protein n=1 Tax=Sedimenticola thiotaurini TaxID=1543721 RepID=A0A0F7K4F2_9GAMM|nr:hypothetical protein AAY24_17635 [Sedimenticola thiotaurini]